MCMDNKTLGYSMSHSLVQAFLIMTISDDREHIPAQMAIGSKGGHPYASRLRGFRMVFGVSWSSFSYGDFY